MQENGKKKNDLKGWKKMPNYTVTVAVTTLYSVQVEANSQDEAEEKAINMEYSDMREIENTVEAIGQIVEKV